MQSDKSVGAYEKDYVGWKNRKRKNNPDAGAEGEKIQYHKTQYVNHYDVIIDTPGEYAENRTLARALVLYGYEADVVGLLLNATEKYSLYSPNLVAAATREVIGIVTQIDVKGARTDLAENWLRLAGCKTIFHVNSITGEGVPDILNHLREPGDILPWEEEGLNFAENRS